MDRPPPDVIGPYLILSELGRGGMGVVYLAEHGQTGDRVALKTLTEPEVERLPALRREIHALRRLDHPGVVAIVDDGVHEGVPWFAMEVLLGHSLADHIDAAGQGRTPSSIKRVAVAPTDPQHEAGEATIITPFATSAMASSPEVEVNPDALAAAPPRQPVEGAEARELDDRARQLLGYLGQVCRALAYTHGEGFIHKDLKPSNVLVTKEGRAVLMDFGVTARTGRRVGATTVEDVGVMAGSIHYMSPEQINARAVDARADLYSVGCILYELLVGEPPFDGPLPVVLGAQLNKDPVPPSAHGVAIPAALEARVLQLLAKDPVERPGHALAVVRTLESLGVDTQARGPEPPIRPYLFSASLVSGRRAVVEDLVARYERAASREGGGDAVLLAGEGGSGKTNLAVELVQRVRSSGRVALLPGQCESVDATGATAARPLHAFSRILGKVADRCRQGGVELTRQILGDHRDVLATFSDEIASLPGYGEGGGFAPIPSRSRVFDALVHVLGAYTAGQPAIFVIDDLQWADQLSLDCLRHLVEHALPEQAWFIVGLFRSEGDLDHLHRALAEVDIVEVGLLTQGEVGEMIQQMLGVRAVPERLTRFVWFQTDGNPYFVVEYLYSAVQRGLLNIDAEGNWRFNRDSDTLEIMVDGLPTPASVLALVQERLEGLSLPARRALEAAAVLGREVEVALMEEVTGVGADALARLLAELTSRHVLEPVGEGRVRFVHDKLRQGAAAHIEDARRARLHLRAARALEPLGDGVAGDLAWHLQRAGRDAEAREAWRRAGRYAADRFAHHSASEHYSRAMDLAAQPAEALPIRLDRVEFVLVAQGLHQEALDALEAGVALARQEGRAEPLARALFLKGEVLSKMTRRLDDAEAALQEALGLFSMHEGEDRRVGVTLKTLATVHWKQARYEVAMDVFRDALAIHVKLGDRVGQGNVLHNMGLVLFAQRKMDEALDHYRQALSCYEISDHLPGRGIAMQNMANLLRRVGRNAEADALHQRAIAIHRKTGNQVALNIALAQLGGHRRRMGQYEQAVALWTQALHIREAMGEARAASIAYQGIGLTRVDQGRLDKAEEPLEASMAIQDELGRDRRAVYTICGLAEVLFHRGQTREAFDALEGALEDARGRNYQMGLRYIYGDIAWLHVRARDFDAAVEAYRAAIALPPVDNRPQEVAEMHRSLAHILMSAGAVDEAGPHVARALELARAQKHPQLTATCLIQRARRLRLSGQLDQVAPLLDDIEEDLVRLGDRLNPIGVLVQRGHLALATGQDAHVHLEAATRALGALGITRDSLIGLEVDGLRRAAEAAEGTA